MEQNFEKEQTTKRDIEDELKQAINKGETAQYTNLAYFYYKKKDFPLCLECLDKALEHKHYNAYTLYGQYYLRAKDVEKAIHYFKLGNEANDMNSTLELGKLYFEVLKDSKNAKIFFDKCYKKGFYKSFYYIGIFHLKGIEGPRDIQKAFETFERGAKKMSLPCITELGKIYFNGNLGEPNFEKAKEYFELGIRQSSSESFYYLGEMYLEGLGVEQNVEKAINLYEQAAKNFNSANVRLGEIYMNGFGVPQDKKLARKYFEDALNKKLSKGVEMNTLFKRLNQLYTEEKLINENIKLLEKGVEKTNYYSIEKLGSIYLFGQGVPKDLDKAIKILEKGTTLSTKNLLKIAQKMKNTL